jgi:hypothetical protein
LNRHERGAALVEFALVSLLLYVIVAATVEFGRLMFYAEALQDIARVAARELAVASLPSAITFDGGGQDGALTYINPSGAAPVRDFIFNPSLLVVDLTGMSDADLDAYFAALPIVNRALRPLMIVDRTESRNLLRYPGALVVDADAPSGFTVAIPHVNYDGGVETIDWVPVVEEIRAEPNCPARGPFSLVYRADLDACPGAPPALPQRAMAAIRINYPYQAAMLTGFRSNPDGPLEPNLAFPIAADDEAVVDLNPPPGLVHSPPPLPPPAHDDPTLGPYGGTYGLGRLSAVAGTVRPFRKLISAQAIFRREVLE